ncbi:hypothetical protein AB0N24_04540 [Arthrobacter sp. NPDC093128]|uniref:hypothetical protein n=1 Tax=Arthrobacter sp. NPDC093128 TaxID=3154979 RepID=UPI00342B294C
MHKINDLVTARRNVELKGLQMVPRGSRGTIAHVNLGGFFSSSSYTVAFDLPGRNFPLVLENLPENAVEALPEP